MPNKINWSLTRRPGGEGFKSPSDCFALLATFGFSVFRF